MKREAFSANAVRFATNRSAFMETRGRFIVNRVAVTETGGRFTVPRPSVMETGGGFTMTRTAITANLGHESPSALHPSRRDGVKEGLVARVEDWPGVHWRFP